MAPKKRPRDESDAPRAPVDSLGPDVTLLVGPGKVHLAGHSFSLRKASGFFNAALQGNWQEAQSQAIELVDSDPDDIRLLLNFLAYEQFIDVTNVARLARMFMQFSMAPAIIEKARSVIHYEICQTEDMLNHLGLPEGATYEEKWVAAAMLAVDCDCSELLDGNLKGFLESTIDKGNGLSAFLPLATDSRYSDYFAKLWPAFRQRLLSPGQLQAGAMQEPPAAETAAYLWPALAYSAHRSQVIRATEKIVTDSLKGYVVKRAASMHSSQSVEPSVIAGKCNAKLEIFLATAH